MIDKDKAATPLNDEQLDGVAGGMIAIGEGSDGGGGGGPVKPTKPVTPKRR